MKQLYYILGICVLLITSCTDQAEEIFSDTPEERLSGVLSDYVKTLTAEDGQWLTYYAGEAILMQFDANGTVSFKSTFNNGNSDRTITYRVGASQVPELIFENHSVFHALYELDRANREYEFLFDKVSDTEIQLISKTDLGENKTRVVFIKGTPSDIDDAKILKPIVDSLSYFKDFYVDDTKVNMRLLTFSGATFIKEENEDGLIVSTPYDMGITKDGVIFVPELNIGGESVSEFIYDVDAMKFTAKNTTKNIEIRVESEGHNSSANAFNKFMEVNFKAVNTTSYGMDSVYTYLSKDISNFSGLQIYSAYGYVLAYAPGHADGNWAGFSGVNYTKSADNNMLVTWDYYVYGNWWQEFYYSRGGEIFLFEFLLDPKGLYIDEIKKGEYVLVSLSNPSKYILVKD